MSKIFQKYHTFPLSFGLILAKAGTFDSDLAIRAEFMSKILQKYLTFPLFFGLMLAKACTFDSYLVIRAEFDVQNTLKAPYFSIILRPYFGKSRHFQLRFDNKGRIYVKYTQNINEKVWYFQSMLNINSAIDCQI